ncbi:MAG TPA: SUMF1/EgtB/PvdO family nonheme iron enzyme [Candidatus Cloacimonadota bacterium]|nr:SUMF1/EgtB/PvdO family nonheme iron enzyme [Candidatus Cloacimonadota bacterium]
MYDMSGNVWEWCWDIFASSYPSGLQNNPTGASNGSSRVMRGGSWINYPDACTVSHRGGFVATHIYSLFGFRILRRAP